MSEDKELRESKDSSKQPKGRSKVLLNGLKIEQVANEVNHEVLDEHVEGNGQEGGDQPVVHEPDLDHDFEVVAGFLLRGKGMVEAKCGRGVVVVVELVIL